MDYNEISRQIAEKNQALGQRYAELPKMESELRESMFGNDSVMNTLNSQEQSKINELFSHDQNVAQQYQQNPQLSTSPSGRVLDPYARELALSNRYKGTAQDLTSIRQGQQTRRDVIGDSLANALKIATQSLEMKKLELDQLQKDRDFAWEVYKEKHKSTGGGQAAVGDLFNTIMGLQQKTKEAAPAQSGKTVTKAKTAQEKSALVSRIRAQYPGKTINLTYNKDGTISYSVLKPKQTVLTPEEADPETINKLAAASIAAGGSTSDVASILQLLGTDVSTKAPTRGDKQDQAIVQLTDDLQRVPQGTTANKLYLQLKNAYPEVPDTSIKNAMNAAGFIIY